MLLIFVHLVLIGCIFGKLRGLVVGLELQKRKRSRVED